MWMKKGMCAKTSVSLSEIAWRLVIYIALVKDRLSKSNPCLKWLNPYLLTRSEQPDSFQPSSYTSPHFLIRHLMPKSIEITKQVPHYIGIVGKNYTSNFCYLEICKTKLHQFFSWLWQYQATNFVYEICYSLHTNIFTFELDDLRDWVVKILGYKFWDRGFKSLRAKVNFNWLTWAFSHFYH